jgi:hypothetical protein
MAAQHQTKEIAVIKALLAAAGMLFSHHSRLAAAIAIICLAFGSAHSAGGLPDPVEPWLANEGDWAADFNDAQIDCYNGSMSACDSIWTSDRVLMDTFLYEYGRTCGGRVDLRQIVQAGLTCAEAFPGYE